MDLNIKKIKVSNLQPSEYNPRQISDKELDKLKRSIDEFGYVEPIIWNEKTNVIVGGHQRVKALLALGRGDEMIDVVVVDLSVNRERALNVALNRISGEWDEDLLASLLQEMEDEDRELSGFDAAEISKMLDGINKELDPEDDEVPEPPEKPVAQRGDIWLLGKHRVMCGDSTKLEDVERLMDGKKDGTQETITISDPPYELDTKGGGVLKNSKAMKGIADLGIDTFDPSTLENNSKTSVYFCNKNLVKKYIELAEEWGVAFDINFYKKENTAPNYGGHLMTDVEYIMILGKQSPNKGLPKETYSKAFTGNKDADNAVAWSKPVLLLEKYIKLFTKRYDIVLDLFLGSGSTLIAAENTERICYGMELDPRYVDVIVKRWEKKTGMTAVKEV